MTLLLEWILALVMLFGGWGQPQVTVEDWRKLEEPAVSPEPSTAPVQMSTDEVRSLALSVSGDPEWSAFAAECFTNGGENRGYVGIVGGPNDDGSFDHGLPQFNDVHADWIDLERVKRDPEYALEKAYDLFLIQGYGAWHGCVR